MTIDNILSTPGSFLREEFERQKALFNAQPIIIQHFINSQAKRLANALVNDANQVHFSLPDRVIDKIPGSNDMAAMLVPVEFREQTIGNWHIHLEHKPILESIRQTLSKLEQSPDQSISASISLMRFATAMHMVHDILPAGRSVKYVAESDEQIPTNPVAPINEMRSALTSNRDAIAQQDESNLNQDELLTPFVPAARRFYLPQWVAVDNKGTLLVNSMAEAESCMISMTRYVAILHKTSSLAPYILADQDYQLKRYGILGQVINQGRALARYKTETIITKILERVGNNSLNRGLSIMLPYYNDQDLRMDEKDIEVIPAGRVSFNPIFVIRAVQLEIARVTQDTRLNSSTRKYYIQELQMFENTFINFNSNNTASGKASGGRKSGNFTRDTMKENI